MGARTFHRSLAILTATLPLAWVACSRTDDGFHLLAIQPDPAHGPLALNASLTLRFDREVDPSSITGNGIELQCDGRPARGRFEVDGNNVTFIPRPVSTLDGSEGGYVPGAELRLVIEGFPGRAGVLDRAGRPLERSVRRSWPVANVGSPGAFLDIAPGRAPVVTNLAALGSTDPRKIKPHGFVRIAFSEPILPSTLSATAIDLRFDNPDRSPVAAEIQFSQGETTSEILVRPVDGFQRETRYLLSLAGGVLTDPSGMAVESMPPITVIGADDGVERLGAQQESDRE